MSEIEKYEQSTMVCRKIFLTSADEIATRLSFLKPLEAEVTSIPDIEQIVLDELRDSLSTEGNGAAHPTQGSRTRT